MPQHIINQETSDVQLPIFKRKTILTHAQILALNTTPIKLVDAPGANKMIDVHKIRIQGKIVVPYNNLGNPANIGHEDEYARLHIAYDGGNYFDTGLNNFTYNGTNYQGLVDLLQGTTERVYSTTPYPVSNTDSDLGTTNYSMSVPGIENKGLYTYFVNTIGALTEGDPTNVIEITIIYSIVDL
jgi:hypothetical protein